VDVHPPIPDRVGVYEITSVYRVGRSVEVPQFVHLSGDWYSFTSSW
jgi:hypothetical protein